MRIRTRLLVFNMAIIGTTAILLAFVAYLLASYQIRRETEGFLADEFREYSHKYATTLDDLPSAEVQMRQHFTKARMTYPIFCRVYDQDGRQLIGVENVSGAPAVERSVVLSALKGEESTYTLGPAPGGREFWCAIKPVHSPTGKLFAFELGMDVHNLQQRIQRLRNYLLVAIPLVLLVSLAGAWWMTRNSLRPVGRLLAKLREIRSTSLHQRLTVGEAGDEFDSLTAAVNDMLSEIEIGFLRVREFTADAAHELRTPLARLTVMLEDSLNRPLSPDQARQSLDEAYEQCTRLRQLVDALMLLARLDRSEQEGQPVACDLSEILLDLEELWSAACKEKGVTLELSAGVSTPVAGRPALLRRLLANLVDNALRHTPGGGSIRVTAEAADENVTVRVADSGPGIAKDDLGKVFDRFYKVDHSRSARTGGTGLGLSICLKIVQLHGGRIEIDSVEGQGTTFTVVLPRNSGQKLTRGDHEQTVLRSTGPPA